ncbi:MAG TPA: prolyl oligopeptidase family serine peptidase, partial [Gemmatimonadaceae bacterium]|nr:prolyl oligopeptidase family serine peptidase [Gemmatimonadaceae bacterium]
WLAFYLDYDPLPAARALRAPVLILQGATDRQVTPDQAGELAAAIRAGGNRDVTVRVLPDVNHLLVHDPSGAFGGYASLPSMKLAPEVVGTVVEWLGEKLRG